MSKLLYLDNAATTKTAPEVVEAMLPYFTEKFGNPSSVYSFAAANKEVINQQRDAIAEMIGAFLGALIAYFMYADHFKISEGQIDGVAIRNIFSTNPNCRNLPRNYFVEAFATFIFLTSIMAAEHANEAMLPFTVGLIVWAIGMGLGGTTGFAMNQARDLGPRFAYQILPIKDKVNNDWQYGLLVPGTAPFVGAVLAFFFIRYFLGIM